MGVRGGALSDFEEGIDRFDWEAEGRRLGETLDDYGCLVVVGKDPTPTALAAIGIARTQSRVRRVALGDLFGEAPPIHRLVENEDPHGLVDTILYGISLNRVAVPVSDNGDLFVIPTGTEPPDYDEIFASPRWRRLTATFREANALLLLVAPSSAPGIERLVAAADGAIVVGDAVPPQLSIADILGSVRATPPVPRPRVSQAHAVPPRRLAPAQYRHLLPKLPWPMPRRTRVLAGSLLSLVLAVVLLFFALRSPPRPARTAAGGGLDSLGQRNVLARASTAAGRTDSAAGSAGTVVPPTPANPEDSASAAAYSVILRNINTPRGAILTVQTAGARLPAATFTPVLFNGVKWFQLRVGAFTRAAQADSLMRLLRSPGSPFEKDSSRVVHAPFAFLLDSAVQPTLAVALLAQYALRDQPAYALRQRDGKVRVYLGAFQTPEESIQMSEELRAAGYDVPLVYRTGRVF